jgi:hypothetical protein
MSRAIARAIEGGKPLVESRGDIGPTFSRALLGRAQRAAPLREKATTETRAEKTTANTQSYGGPMVNPGPYDEADAACLIGYNCGLELGGWDHC